MAQARAEHNYLTETEGLRQFAFNGAGITVYGPNMNLVKDPRYVPRFLPLIDEPCGNPAAETSLKSRLIFTKGDVLN